MPKSDIPNLSKIRRLDNPRDYIQRIGVTLNADGSVFDKTRLQQFHSLAEWYKCHEIR